MGKSGFTWFTGLDKPIFYGSIILLLILTLPLFIFPDWSTVQLEVLNDNINDNAGFLYQWLAIIVTIFALWVAFSKAGHIKLGVTKPSFNTFSWASMIFCAGVATGILFWGCIEWAYYVIDPPLNAEPYSNEAIELASSYDMFHWGPVGWSFYAIPALAIGHTFYNLGFKTMRISVACSGVLGKYANGVTGKVIDILFMIGLLGSAGTSLAIGTPMIAAAVNDLFGTGTNFIVNLGIILACTLIYATTVYLGLSRGIKRLSNFSTTLAFLFLGFILLAGPTVFIIKMFTNSVGLMTQNFIRMITWTDPLVNSGFVEDWSIFYWSWWVAVGPWMGIFIAKISKGRNFRQVILGTLIFGSAGCSLFYGIFGNYALFQELSGVFISTDLVKKGEAALAITEVVKTLPWGTIILFIFTIMSLAFIATTLGSTSYVMATYTTSYAIGNPEPGRQLRIFWALFLSLLPLGLILIGGLEALKTAVLLTALPLILIYIFMIISIFRWINTSNQ